MDAYRLKQFQFVTPRKSYHSNPFFNRLVQQVIPSFSSYNPAVVGAACSALLYLYPRVVIRLILPGHAFHMGYRLFVIRTTVSTEPCECTIAVGLSSQYIKAGIYK